MNSRVRCGLAGSLVGLALGACTQTTPAPQAGTAPSLTPSTLPAGSGCSGEIARFQAVLKSDAATGNVNRSVYNRAEPDIDRASAACAAGRDGEARSMLASTKSRFGYR